jgi:CubicO group peptidase (beta-lactamase class C family)
MPKLQFRVLYREFLFRMVDMEVLAAHALGDSNKLLGQFASLLLFISVWMALGAFGFASARMGPQVAFVLIMITEHFLIATTMLVVGLFAVLSWDSTFPNRRDVLVLAPLPVRPRTMFLAKVAAVGTALALTVALMHSAMGLVWPYAFEAQAVAQPAPILTFDPTPSPVSAAGLQSVMDRDLRPVLARGELGGASGNGLVIGVFKQGERRIFSYGPVQADSLFEIGSLTKTFTALILARMAEQGKLKLEEPVRQLLPPGTVAKPRSGEIKLVDLATHHSGVWPNPPYFNPNDPFKPFGDDRVEDLYAVFRKHGVAMHPEPRYEYSNLGFGLLGRALVERSGMNFADLLRDEITAPLNLPDTVVDPTPAQQARYAQGYAGKRGAVPPMYMDALIAAGGIRSTAADALSYLEANLHPEKAGPLAGAIRDTHRVRADAMFGAKIGLAWEYREENGAYSHSGRTVGFTTFAFFSPRHDFAAVILLNQGSLRSLALIEDHVRQRLAGEPAVVLDETHIPASKGFSGVLRWYFAYWFTMMAAGVFIYCGVLALQGTAAQVLPRHIFLRISGLLQMACFCLFLTIYFLQPIFGSMEALDSPHTRGVMLWLPTYWFLGLFHQLNGSQYAPLVPLAHRAWIGLAVVIVAASIGYALSYVRTLRQIVEEPDITPGVRTFNWLPPFGDRVQTAIAQFAVRGLSRSRQHRLILAFYLGIGFAMTIFLLKAPEIGKGADTPLLAASVVMLALAIIGTRVVFAFPLDLRANWVFQIVGLEPGRRNLAASRRSLLFLSALPVWMGSAVLCLRQLPWRQAAAHMALLALLAVILTELSMLNFRKIPFACSYLPGKSQIHMVFLASLGLFWGVMLCVKVERSMLQTTQDSLVMLAPVALVAAGLRFASSRIDVEDLKFEESMPNAIQQLGLPR